MDEVTVRVEGAGEDDNKGDESWPNLIGLELGKLTAAQQEANAQLTSLNQSQQTLLTNFSEIQTQMQNLGQSHQAIAERVEEMQEEEAAQEEEEENEEVIVDVLPPSDLPAQEQAEPQLQTRNWFQRWILNQ